MIKVDCNLCRKELVQPGALMFSPPDQIDHCRKWHLCVTCWHTILDFLQDNQR